MDFLNANVKKLWQPIKTVGDNAVHQLNSMVREAVSRDKYRFKDDQFDLDLCYITNRLIAMGYPGSNVEKAWRNSKEDVAKFFKTYHPGHYKIFNVSERTYDTAEFENQVEYLGWSDHHPPTLENLMQCIQTIDSWLNADPENVAGVHCMAGRGRTGTVIAAYLVHTRVYDNAESALRFFAVRRSASEEGVQVPSQKRYVKYIQDIVKETVPLSPDCKILKLKCIILKPVPKCNINGECTPIIQVLCMSPHAHVLYSNEGAELKTFKQSDTAMMIETGGVALRGDIFIRVFNEGIIPLLTDRSLLRFGFHTSFVSNFFLDFNKGELDGGEVGALTDESFPADFGVRLVFSQ